MTFKQLSGREFAPVTRAVDTNVLVRLITRDDPRQTVDAETFASKGAWVPILALAEAIRVLQSVYQQEPSLASYSD